MMIVGGVDSYLDLYVLGTLDLDKRIKSSTHLDGLIPGEGADSCSSPTNGARHVRN